MNDMAEVKLRYLHKNTSRHGTDRYYVRLPGRPLVRLHGAPGTEEFMRAYFAAIRGEVGAPAEALPAVRRPAAGSFREAWVEYRRTPEFLSLAPSTQSHRIRVMESMLLEPVVAGKPAIFGDGPLKEFTPKLIRILRDRKSEAPEAANHRLKVLRRFFEWACEDGERIASNPTRDVKPLRSHGDGHHTWTVEEVGQYLAAHEAGSKARLAIGLLLFVGIRISDLAIIGPQHVRDGEITFTPYKTRRTRGKALTLPILPALEHILSQSEVGHLSFMVTGYGKPFSIKGLGQWFKKQCVKAGLGHCSAHGLRKAGATICAENGATEEQLKAIYGWENAKEANLYTRKARQKLIAVGAMPLLDMGETVNELIHQKKGV